MHTFYITNNLGGGGTNVSRFSVYQGILKNTSKIGLLLNYYYLNTDISKSTSFDGDILKKYREYNTINEFLNAVRKHFISKKRIINNYTFSITELPLESYLLDSGIGNILRDLINRNELTNSNVKKLIKPYHAYGEDLSFNILIALDYALKYTYKKGERLNKDLKNIWEELANNQDKNIILLKETLLHMKSNTFKHKIYAPIHGFNFRSFFKYGEKIKELENQIEISFDGYALGGIASTTKLNNDIWDVPENLNRNQKSTWIVSKLCKQAKLQFIDKPLHVLGAGNIYSLPFLTYFGATSSDCHSIWRRASDGDSKILIPLLKDDLSFYKNENIFEFKKIKDLKEGDYNFDLPENLSITELKELYNSKNKEEYYYAQLLIFFHAVKQYDLLNNFMVKNSSDYLTKLTKTPDSKLNDEYKKLIELLCSSE